MHYEDMQTWCERPSLPPEVMVISGLVLPRMVMSDSMALLQQGSVSISAAGVTTKDHVDLLGLGCPSEAMLISEYRTELHRSLPGHHMMVSVVTRIQESWSHPLPRQYG